jgi:hypothetical protein
VPKTIDAERKVVVVEVAIKMTKNDPKPTEKTWTLDYSNVDLEDLLERASRSDVITLQARYRNKPFDQTTFDVAKDLTGRPVGEPKNPLETIKALMAKMTPEEFQAILEQAEDSRASG